MIRRVCLLVGSLVLYGRCDFLSSASSEKFLTACSIFLKLCTHVEHCNSKLWLTFGRSRSTFKVKTPENLQVVTSTGKW